MTIPATARRFLDMLGGEYQLVPLPAARSVAEAAAAAHVPLEKLVRAELLQDDKGRLLALLPASGHLDPALLSGTLGRHLETAPQVVRQRFFADCDPDALPPLADAYGLPSVLDEALTDLDEVYFTAGSRDTLVRMSGKRFLALQAGARRLHFSAATPPATLPERPLGRMEVKARVEAITALPAMPEMARRLLVLRSNPYADVDDLARVIELDPSLSAQIIRYARSPFFSYRGKVVSVQSAISRVLGYEPVMNIALGIATARPFRNPHEGPLGLDAFWRDAVYCAALTQSLINALPYGQRPKPGLAYLSGLLHNFGFVLLGHLFPPEFAWLNHNAELEPDTPVLELEGRLMDITHIDLGVWLMEAWRMPGEVISAIREHHNPDYADLHAVYPNLVLAASRLLKRHGIGDGDGGELPTVLLERLGLHEDHAVMVLDTMLESREHLDDMARQMVS